ncbi:exodeoxyribonuclease III [Candidatus Nomurabacteria bacterium RIFCSPLOWO2_01_FULL_33_24]|uniref:Exodeoxyribonuclease III n=1 Tax=Candidatus Nomurabacteria bacterium RIFCSPLOWO2_01_FULL_33_24 TaxID=1801765 RepID=A0A1F6WZD5_9BACT|nr:MAG: exodeoxyribonuclease III [Candidatus Nomurabacteria bacterium RIFCSPLOWO2_01_FULL_33_24]
MKIISWNVNGLRALERQGYWGNILKKNPDIFCLQETKAHPDQLSEEVKLPKGYLSFFSSSEIKKGYSGVALYSKVKPKKVEYGIGIKKFDQEGRIIVSYFDGFVLLNIYFPNGGMSPERLEYKLEFYDAFLKFINKLRKKGYKIIFCGDINTAHEEIDLARPKANEQNTGFLPEERAWLDEIIASGYVDVFRHFFPNKKDTYTYWDLKTRARDRNVGWRIDYFFISADLIRKIKSTTILKDIYGSDHCPIEINIKIK